MRVTHHMLWSTDSPHDSPLSHLFIAAWLTAPPPLINQPGRLTNLFSWRSRPMWRQAHLKNRCRYGCLVSCRHKFVHQRAPTSHILQKVAGVSRCTEPTEEELCGLTVEWTGQRLRTSSRTRSRPAPPSQEPCGHPGSGLILDLKIPSPWNHVNIIKDVFGHEINSRLGLNSQKQKEKQSAVMSRSYSSQD